MRKLRESDFYLARKRYQWFLKGHEGKRKLNIKQSAPSSANIFFWIIEAVAVHLGIGGNCVSFFDGFNVR